MFKPKTPIAGRMDNSSGGWIRTNGLRVMSKTPESVLFVRRVLQKLAPAAPLPWRAVPGSAGVSQTDERWSRSTLWVHTYPARSR